MSLDVYLSYPATNEPVAFAERIYVREDGATKEITRAEWYERFPDREPVVVVSGNSSGEVYSANITHNLGRMADEAKIYDCLWSPGESGITKASQLIQPLRDGLALLVTEPERFQPFNPPNGWGSYEVLVRFVRDYLVACETWPDAEVSVWK